MSLSSAQRCARNLGFALAILAAAPSARAQTSDKALAEALFREGRELMDAGRTGEACGRFEESQRLEPSVGTLMNLALCHEALGKTASAWGEFSEVAVEAGRVGQAKREAFALERAAALEARLSKIQLVVSSPPPGIVLSVDGRDLAAGSFEAALPLDPGTRVIEARAPGHAPWRQELSLEPGPVLLRVEVPPLELLPAVEPPRAPRLAAATTTPSTPTPQTARGVAISPLVWVGLGTIVVGSAVGTGTGLASIAKTDAIREDCDGDVCPSRLEGEADEALVLASVSNVSFGIAAAGAVVGVIGLVLSDFDAPAAAASPSVGLGVTRLGTIGVVGRF